MRSITADAPLLVEARLHRNQPPTKSTMQEDACAWASAQRAELRRSPCLRLPAMGHASAHAGLVTPLFPGSTAPSAPACYVPMRTPFYHTSGMMTGRLVWRAWEGRR